MNFKRLPFLEKDVTDPPDFHCDYATGPGKQCLMCDCFVETHPESPWALHPEDFIVGESDT